MLRERNNSLRDARSLGTYADHHEQAARENDSRPNPLHGHELWSPGAQAERQSCPLRHDCSEVMSRVKPVTHTVQGRL